jgi:hypothetical protein
MRHANNGLRRNSHLIWILREQAFLRAKALEIQGVNSKNEEWGIDQKKKN